MPTISTSIRTHIRTDAMINKSSFDRDYKHFTRVFMDNDLMQEPKFKVLAEHQGCVVFLIPSMKTYLANILIVKSLVTV